MKIIAVSDLHGNLISIKDKCDIFIVAGDWSPLYIQDDYYTMFDWIDYELIPWLLKINSEHIILIPGNHDLICEVKRFKDDFDRSLFVHGIYNKVHYLCHSSVIIGGKYFYGNPNNESPSGWAFSKQINQKYKFDKDTDVLITHQPPKIGNVGYVSKYHRDLGSKSLRDEIFNSNIELNICGHIHTGEHGETPIMLNNGKLASIYNVSILDEDYIVSYKPTIIEIQ